MKVRARSYFLVVVLVVMLAAIGYAAMFPYLESKLLPIAVGGLVFVLAAIELTRELSAEKRTTETANLKPEKIEQKLERMEARVGTRRYLVVTAWILGLFVAVCLIGFTGGILLFVFSFLKSAGRGWLLSLGMAVLVAGFIYVIFRLALGVYLYTGLLFGGQF